MNYEEWENEFENMDLFILKNYIDGAMNTPTVVMTEFVGFNIVLNIAQRVYGNRRVAEKEKQGSLRGI